MYSTRTIENLARKFGNFQYKISNDIFFYKALIEITSREGLVYLFSIRHWLLC